MVEEGGFTRAADRPHLAHPGIGAQVRGLERELGRRLLDRGGRPAHPAHPVSRLAITRSAAPSGPSGASASTYPCRR
ncbi:LysR family transcriptional regulator [Kitasatospora sp. NPDC008115]|uniref:helix-turn-helix domain-containing protein n=1 Tax=Kitasatospora sp. NPDC008115 TaxID=3364022 RepID=UPI0036EC08B7